MRGPHIMRLTAVAMFLLAGGPAALAQTAQNAAVDQVFADYAKAGSPGCALGAFQNGKIIYERGYGLANVEGNVPITPQTVFDIGSTSKQFTAASILLLEKQGKLSVHDDIRKYIPELPDYGRPITILNLLNHTSGLRDYLVLMSLSGINLDSVTTDGDALGLIARQKRLNFEPGTDYLYSNTGFFLLSVIVKRVSGKSLREFAQENIFAPLGMGHTQYRDDHTLLIPNRALAYDPKEGGGYSLDVSYFEQTGDGAVHTTVEDLQKWDENFYSGQIGGMEFLAEIQEPGKLASGKTLDYAKGLVVSEYRGLRTVSHGGSWGGYRAQLLRFPGQHFSVACLCNIGTADTTALARGVADAYLSAQMKTREPEKAAPQSGGEPSAHAGAESPTLTAEELAAYAGDYWSEELRVTYRIAARDGGLVLTDLIGADLVSHAEGFVHRELRPAGSDEFQMTRPRWTFDFTRDAAHRVNGFRLDAGRTLGMAFIRIQRGPGLDSAGKP